MNTFQVEAGVTSLPLHFHWNCLVYIYNTLSRSAKTIVRWAEQCKTF